MTAEKTQTKTDKRGTKRTCQNSECGSRFYDLNREEIKCPICDTPYVIATAPPVTEETKPPVAEQKKADAVDPEAVDDDAADLVDIEAGDDDDPVADDAFLETDDDENADVAGIVAPPVDDKED